MAGLGDRLRRIEDPPLLKGQGRFAADISFPAQLHMRIVRSPVAFGRIGRIDVEDALASSGVVAILTGADVADIPPIDYRQVKVKGLEPYRQPILAQDMVRYVGEPVAAVFAETPYFAEDAEELIRLEIEALAPYLQATAPLAEFAPGLSSEAAVIEKAYGDLDDAFARAAHIVELELAVGRHSGVPLETRGAVARYDPDKGRLELHGAAKIPHINRLHIAKMLGLELDQLHLFEGHVGGGFGIRGELYPEDVLVCLGALRLGRPVKWIEDRREHLLAANHSRDQVHKIKAAVADDGFILGLDDEFWTDQGAYVRSHAATVSDLTAAMLPGPYLIPAFRAVGHIRLTNKTPAGTYRAPGRYEGSFVRERLLDAIAHRLHVDRVAVRRRNLIPDDAMPFERGVAALDTEVVYDSGRFEHLLDRLVAHVDYAQLERSLAKRRQAGEPVGSGLGFFVEKSGLGPFDDVRVELGLDGRVEVVTGVASVGQGVETVLAQVCGEVLDMTLDRIRVVHGQTDRIARGMGAFASRVTVMAGSAVSLAVHDLRRQLLARAAELLQTAPDRLALRAGQVRLADGAAGPSLELGALAAAIAGESGAPPAATATFETEHMTYPYGIHLAVVRVDPDSFGVTVERFVVAYDVGRAVNPTLVEGQIAGGTAQGIGGALLEAFVYDQKGEPLAVSFADYLLPTAAEMPPCDILVSEDAPSPINPLGVKGAGEGGITGAGAAIAAAVDAALGRPGLITRLPITPSLLHALLRGSA